MLARVAAAIGAMRRAWYDPEATATTPGFAERQQQYRILWAYYSNTVFDDARTWSRYKATYKLYRAIRPIYNPTKRLVDGYAGLVYPGVLSEDGRDLPDGTPSAIPLADDTPPELTTAIAQLWQWGNWQAGKALYVRYGALTGSVLVEVIDDTARGKVTSRIVWPGMVDALALDGSGNVQGYAVEFVARDALGQAYRYRREVTREAFRTFKDDKPYAYDSNGSEWTNPYGFVPAVWAKHRDIGDDYGAPAIDGALGKIDELNSFASHVHDQGHKKIAAPAILWAQGNVKSLTSGSQAGKRAATEDLDNPYADREDVLIWQGPPGGRVDSMAGMLDLSDALPYIEKLLDEIDHDLPELVLWSELREMQQVTGPGAARLIGDVANRVYESAANYDQQSIKLFQMQTAIAGYRANAGDWGARGRLTRQQAKFLRFDLDSYASGALDFAIVPRPLVTKTARESIEESQMAGQAAAQWTAAGMPLEAYLKFERGWTDEQLAELASMSETQLAGITARQQLAQADTVPPPGVQQ